MSCVASPPGRPRKVSRGSLVRGVGWRLIQTFAATNGRVALRSEFVFFAGVPLNIALVPSRSSESTTRGGQHKTAAPRLCHRLSVPLLLYSGFPFSRPDLTTSTTSTSRPRLKFPGATRLTSRPSSAKGSMLPR